MPQPQPAHSYLRVLEGFSSDEISQICQLKRVFEWAQGDPEFGARLDAGGLTAEDRSRLEQIGVAFDIDEIAVLWESAEFGREYMRLCASVATKLPTEQDERTLERYPLLALWARYLSRRNTIYRETRKTIFPVPRAAPFDAWRRRRIGAVRSELGFFGHFIDHPILAFELGDGCNVNCWFCAFAARKLTKNLDYEESRDYFRDIVRTCVDLFGQAQASMALPYYGTEPHDNPRYIDFLRDFEQITGSPVCTSTAVGTDPEWIRSLIAYYRRGSHPWPRISVLTRAALHRIHDLYSPEELRDVELLIQTKDNRRQKVTGGRILEEQEGLRGREEGDYLDAVVPQGSIACVSGFLTNLVNRTVQLVSPCYTAERWPHGYRVFDSESFADAPDFRRAVTQLVERNMPTSPQSDRVAGFRDDLVFRATAEGFDLVSPNQIHHLKGEVYLQLGPVLADRNSSFGEVYDLLVERHGQNPMVTVAVVQKLFDEGLLDEVQPERS